MIEHVYRRAAQAQASAVIVATDDDRIRQAVEGFGGTAVMTSTAHATGSDRLAEAVAALDGDIVINVQADEPLIEPAMIDEAAAALRDAPEASIGTLRKAITDAADLGNPNVVKVVVDLDGRALYFSRAGIPYARGGAPAAPSWRHVGIYAYRRAALLALAALAPTPLEQTEMLEQLRALEHGYRIQTRETMYDTIGVDTADDLDRVRRRLTTGASSRGL